MNAVEELRAHCESYGSDTQIVKEVLARLDAAEEVCRMVLNHRAIDSIWDHANHWRGLAYPKPEHGVGDVLRSTPTEPGIVNCFCGRQFYYSDITVGIDGFAKHYAEATR